MGLSDGPSNVTISGPDALEVGVKASFKCTAHCSPSCSYTWNVYGRTMQGSVVDITVNRYVATESFSCEAHNTVTGKTATSNETLSVTGTLKLWCIQYLVNSHVHFLVFPFSTILQIQMFPVVGHIKT